MKTSSILEFIDNLFLIRINDTVNYLFEKNLQNDQEQIKGDSDFKCNLKTLKSKAIPFAYNVHSVKEDTIILENAINEKEKHLGNKNWSALDMYLTIFKAFKKDYIRYVLLTFILIVLDAFVKYRGILYIGALIGTRTSGDNKIGLISGLFIFFLKATFLLSDTHLKYYILRVRTRVIGSINGVSLLRLSKCDSNSCLNQSKDTEQKPKSKISRYQNVISVDSDFSENAISYSIRIFIFPIKLASTFAIAVKTFDDNSTKLLIFSLSTLFSGAILSLFISTLFKKPFIAHREKRISDTTNIIENSRSLNLTQDHIISTYHRLLSDSRQNEMRFGSFRKYFFTLEEIISRSMGFFCYGIISIYVWHNHFDIYKSIEMIIDSAILVPSFYTPLQELCYLIYYISEGNNALNRLAKLMQITKKKVPAKTDLNNITHELEIINKNENIILHVNTSKVGAYSPQKVIMKYGVPVIFSCNDISYNYLLTDLLRRLVFGINGEDGIQFELERSEDIFENKDQTIESSESKISQFEDEKAFQVLADISNPVCYVPLDSWITDGMSLADIILNGREYDHYYWEKVIDICELRNDFISWGILSYDLARSTIFSQIQFSKGQKVRLSLSRALYGIGSKNGELYNPKQGTPILILDSIFCSLDPPVCCSILTKLFNNQDGLLKNVFSIIVLDTQMLTFLPGNILESEIHVIPAKDNENRKFVVNNDTPKSTTSVNTFTSINTIINDYCFETDLSKELWELSTEEDEIFNLSSNSNSNEGEMTDTQSSPINDKEFEQVGFNNNKHINQTEEFKELLPKKEGVSISPGNSHSTLFFYILKAANKFKYPNNWSINERIKESSLEMILYLVFLLLPQFILVFGNKILLGNLSRVSETGDLVGGILGIDILYFTYFLCIILAIILVVLSGILEVYVGLRAASNIHNSFLLGYIGSKLSSCIRYLPVSFVLNRISLDQLTIDYCTTKRIGQFVTAINRVMEAIYLSIIASEFPVLQIILFSMFFYILHKYVFRYFIHSCRLLHNTYISETSLLVDTVRNICDGKECIQPQKLDKFYLENGYDQLQEIMRPVYIQSSLEAWLKIRLQVGIIIPVTFLNIFSSYFSDRSSKILIALVIATAFGSLGRVDEVVRYLMRLERELVSVERMRKYLELIKDEYTMKCNGLLGNKSNDLNNGRLYNNIKVNYGNSNDKVVVLESAYGYHSNLSSENEKSQLDRSEVRGTLVKQVCCLSNINVVANKGEIIGIVGRSGSGKTSLLFLIAKSLEYKGTVNHSIAVNNDLINNNHIISCKLCRSNVDEQIMKIFLEDYYMMRHVAMLPVEVFFNENTTIRQSIDPFDQYSNDNIISALNICGISNYLLERETMSNLGNCVKNKSTIGGEKLSDETTILLAGSDKFTLINKYLNMKIGELSLPMQIQRMLLFTHYFLRRNEISILLIDEPPVIYYNEHSNPNFNSSKKLTLITNIIFKYFSHSTTFIVAHDIRNLNGIKKFWYLHRGTLIIKKL